MVNVCDGGNPATGYSGDWQSAGVWHANLGSIEGRYLDASRLEITIDFLLESDSLADTFYFPLLQVNAASTDATYINWIEVAMYQWGIDHNIGTWTGSVPYASHDFPGAPSIGWHKLRVSLQSGTVSGSPGSENVAADGWIKIYWDDELLFDYSNIALAQIVKEGKSVFDGIQIGFAGMYAHTNILITDGAVVTPPEPPSAIFDTNARCCGDEPTQPGAVSPEGEPNPTEIPEWDIGEGNGEGEVPEETTPVNGTIAWEM
jgi:hypothetical protein